MPKNPSQEEKIDILFKHLEHRPSVMAFPTHGQLAAELGKLSEKADKTNVDVLPVGPLISSMFATASVEMWLRGVHSFMISSSLTETSPLWASVSGYYASHYCVRGAAHLFGYFQLFTRKRIVGMDIQGGRHYCYFESKGGKDKEHKYYWKLIKTISPFKDNEFFTDNSDGGDVESDSGHRNVANYCDHINRFPNFQPLNRDELVNRITQLSKISLSSVPIPQKNKYPDVTSVQLIAYHRLIAFRKYLDDTLPSDNAFWKLYRTPAWCSDYLNFQVVEPSFVSVYKGVA